MLWVSNTYIYRKYEDSFTVFFEFPCLLRGVLECLKDIANVFILCVPISPLTSPPYSMPYSRCEFKSIIQIYNDNVARMYLQIKWYSRAAVNLQLAHLEKGEQAGGYAVSSALLVLKLHRAGKQQKVMSWLFVHVRIAWPTHRWAIAHTGTKY